MQTTFVITYVTPGIKRANNDMPLDHTVIKRGRDVTGRGEMHETATCTCFTC